MGRGKKTAPKYRLEITWSAGDNCYVVAVPELPGCMTHGESIEEAIQMAYEAIAGYLESLKARKLPIPTPLAEREFSGKVPLRIDSALHRDLSTKAQISGMSLNKYIESRLKKAV